MYEIPIIRNNHIKTKSNIGMDRDGNDLSNKTVVIGDYPKNIFGEAWFEINTPKVVTLSLNNFDVSNTVNEINAEFVSRIKNLRGSDYHIDPDQCVCASVDTLFNFHIFLLDELEELLQ